MARILVIDDEEPIRRVLRRVLESEGHAVLDASDGNAALRLHQSATLDLVITDIHMPEKDGFEVIMTLRREAPQLKVIAMSGGGRLGNTIALQSAQLLGALMTVQKPFVPSAIIRAVNEALAA